MKVFVTGATGFVGSAVVQDLLQAGHEVVGLARSDDSAAKLEAAGASFHRGALEDLESLREGAANSDGVIHTAFVHDFSDIAASGEIDLRAVEAMGEALAGSNRPLVVTSGIAIFRSGHLGTEDEGPDTDSAGVHRIASEEATVALASRGVRASVLRLPPSVHGTGDYGFVPALIEIARKTGVSGFVGDGMNRWPAVHRSDAAQLFRLALEKGKAGSRFHGIAEEGVPVREIAEAIGRGLGLPVESRPREHFGWLGHFFAGDFLSTSTMTRARLGWEPSGPSLLEDLADGGYFREN